MVIFSWSTWMNTHCSIMLCMLTSTVYFKFWTHMITRIWKMSSNLLLMVLHIWTWLRPLRGMLSNQWLRTLAQECHNQLMAGTFGINMFFLGRPTLALGGPTTGLLVIMVATASTCLSVVPDRFAPRTQSELQDNMEILKWDKKQP